MREVSQQAAEQRVREIASLPIDIVGVGDDLGHGPPGGNLQGDKKNVLRRLFWRGAGEIKKREFVTGDPEFKAIEKEIKSTG